MLKRKTALATAACAIAASALGTSSASATTVENAGGALAAGTSVGNNASDPSTLHLTGLGGITCTITTANFTVGASGGATVSATMDTLTFQSCTDTIPVITISSCHLVTPLPTGHITGIGSTGGTVELSNTYVRCNVSGGTSGCYYFAQTASGAATNAAHTLAYSGVAVSHIVPPGGTGDLGSLCTGPSNTGSFSSRLTNLQAGGSAVAITG